MSDLHYTSSNNALSSHQHTGDVGIDLPCLEVFKKLSDKTTLYETGIAVSPPDGYYLEIVPRSSISKSGYIMSNSFGIIDREYRGTLKVALTKIDDSFPDLECPFTLCQLILRPAYFMNPVRVEELSKTIRGDGGFGSTNLKKLKRN